MDLDALDARDHAYAESAQTLAGQIAGYNAWRAQYKAGQESTYQHAVAQAEQTRETAIAQAEETRQEAVASALQMYTVGLATAENTLRNTDMSGPPKLPSTPGRARPTPPGALSKSS